MAGGFIAIGSGPAGLSAAETFRSMHPGIPVRILSADSAVVIGGGLIACEAAACLAGRGVPTAMVAAEAVPLQRRFGDQVGERVAKMLSDNGVRFLGSTNVTAIDNTRVHLDTGGTLDGDVVVSAGRRIRAEHRNGFTVWYESGGEVVGVLSLNADEDYRLADQLVRSHTPMAI